MLRRSFLKGALGAAVAGAALGLRPAQAEEKEYFLNQFSVAGFQYYDGPRLLSWLKKGQEFSLRAEPKNPYDQFAIEIRRGGRKLGYVPRSDNRHLSRLLAQGARLRCRAVEVCSEGPTWQMLKVKVTMLA